MIAELAATIDAGEAAVLATVVRTHRSVPRRPGSKMLVFADGRTVGTVGGGEMEHRVRLEATDALNDGRPRMVTYALVNPAEGDAGVCGGESEIYLEPFMPKPLLYVIGAGHVGRAVSDLAQWLGFRTVVWDDRSEVVDEVEHADEPLTGPIDQAIAADAVTPAASIIMVTRNVALDLEILPHLLSMPVGYIGLMGSNRRWETTRNGLVGLGVSNADLDRVHAPIGVEIHAETPEEIAVSILAQVIAQRRDPSL